MTRILFTTNPLPGHVRPLIPIVSELVAAGHNVTWYTGREFESFVTRTGAGFAPIVAELEFAGALRHGAGRRRLAALNKVVLEIFLKPIPTYVSELTAVFDGREPEVVVADHAFRAGLFLAEQRGIPRVAVSLGPLNLSSSCTAPFGTALRPSSSLPGRLRNRAFYWLMHHLTFREAQKFVARVRADMGLKPLGGFFIDWAAVIADRYLQSGIPDFEYPRPDLPRSVEFVGAIVATGVDDWAPPDWWPDIKAAKRDGRPVVFVTQGTLDTDPGKLVLPAITALAAMDALVVVTSSGRDPEELLSPGRRPANVRISAFIPYTEVLPLADLMVTNGGYGGVQLALAHGVPLVVCGTSEDKREINARVEWAGAGVSLRTGTPGAAELREAVRKVLGSPLCLDKARQLQRAYARYPGAPRAVEAILEVAAAGRNCSNPL